MIAEQAENFSDQELWQRIAAEGKSDASYARRMALTASAVRPPAIDLSLSTVYGEDGSIIFINPDKSEEQIFPAAWLKPDMFMFDQRYAQSRSPKQRRGARLS